MSQHLIRLVEARLHYFASAGVEAEALTDLRNWRDRVADVVKKETKNE